MTKLEKLIYDAIQRTPVKHGVPDYEADSKAVAAAVLPLIEEAFDAVILNAGTVTEFPHRKGRLKAEWLSENITCEANKKGKRMNKLQEQIRERIHPHVDPITDEEYKSIVEEIEKFCLEIATGFVTWHDKLSPSQKCTVWPPAGSGAGTGLYDKSKKDLFEEYLSELSGNTEQLKERNV